MVLLFKSRPKLFPRKLKSKWLSSFTIKEVMPYCVIMLEDLISKYIWIVNSHRLKLHFGSEIDWLITRIPLNDP